MFYSFKEKDSCHKFYNYSDDLRASSLGLHFLKIIKVTAKEMIMSKSFKRVFMAVILPLLVFSSPAFAVDSFFDVFFDIEYSDVSRSPLVRAQGFVIDERGDTRTVETEILSMSLTSGRASKEESVHTATVKYRAFLPDGKPVRGFVELSIRCGQTAGCFTESVRPLSRNEFRGHVTVLK